LRKITPVLVSLLQEKKAARLEKLARRVYTQRFNDLKFVIELLYDLTIGCTGRLLPQMEDICLLPEIRSMIDIDVDIPVSKESLERDVSPILPGLIARWYSGIDDQIVKMAERQLGTSDGADLSQLACAVFQCSRCHRALWYPELLAHHCLHEKIEAYWNLPWTTYEEKVVATFHSRPWSSKLLEPQSWERKVQSVITTCGMDPYTATRSEMNESDARLLCKLCRQLATRTIMTWRAAVLLPFLLDVTQRSVPCLF
jgi:hypothetical protein